MATMPLSPFVRTDVPRLTDQSTSLATLAANIHARDPNEMSQDDVDSASAHVLAAQTPFDVINDTNNNRLDSGPVFALVDSAIEAIRAI
jgi:hypothetical protein